MSVDAEIGGVRELRLAVVLYGGVSLAIYMHGTTKELHRLVKGSVLAERGGGEAEGSPSEEVYRRLLDRITEHDPKRVRTRVVVDIIAGTSAGGINGVVLAKALAHNRSQDALRDVWLDNGDIRLLLRGRHPIPWKLRVPGRLLRLNREAPLDGAAMSTWLYQALSGMDDGPGAQQEPTTLMPEDHLLELFVTTTDLSGYVRELTIADPRVVDDVAHRHVLCFVFGDGRDDFGEEDNGWLAFAARATSCFPGAFDAVTLRSFIDAAKPRHGLPRRERFFRSYALSHTDPEDRQFIDGGVLDNRPFDHAVHAIMARPAESEVDRRLLYLEPDPAEHGDAPRAVWHGPIATVLSSVAGIPRKQPILDEILEVRRHNERVGQLQDIIEMSFADVEARVKDVVGDDVERQIETADDTDLERWSVALNEEAKRVTGPGYSTYLRSKVTTVVARYAQTICRLSDYPEDCNQSAFVRSVLHGWAHDALFTQRDGRVAPDDRYVAFLRSFDLDYGARRLRFVIDGLSWLYTPKRGVPAPSREQLDRGKAVLNRWRSVLIDAMAGRNLGDDLTRRVADCFGESRIAEWSGTPEDFVVARADQLHALERGFRDTLENGMQGFGAKVVAAIREVMAGWHPHIRKALLIRYLGFPLWDAILFPIQAAADLGERDVVEVVRFSPKDARQLRRVRPALCGISTGHFGAFFDRPGRERDYLLGRLDGAERLIGLLLGEQASHQERAEWCRQAFAAIVNEEQGALAHAGELLADVRRFSFQPEGVDPCPT